MKSALLLLALVGCTDSVPDKPSYQADIKPILDARCIRCHAYPAISATHEDERFDTYDTREAAGGALIMAISDNLPNIKNHLIGGFDPEYEKPFTLMPPRYPLTDVQLDTIVKWIDAGGERGDPRPGNHEPELSITFDQNKLSFDYDLTDADDDYVAGVVVAIRIDGSEYPMLELSSGRGRALQATYTPPTGAYSLEARLDDGAMTTRPMGIVVFP